MAPTGNVTAVRNVALSAVGRDRPGIVAAVTGVLAEHGGNLQGSTMSTLQGQFAIVLIVAVPEGVDAATIESDLQPVAEQFDLLVAARTLHGDDGADVPVGGDDDSPDRQALSVAVHGADRPGIVHGITAALADAGGNIVDLSTHLVGEPDRPVYTVAIRATVPAAAADDVADRLQRAAADLGVHVSVRPDDAAVL